MKKKRSASLIDKQNRVGYLFILPFLIGLGWLFLPSLFETVYYAFNDVSLSISDGLKMDFIKFDNFKTAFEVDTGFRQLLLNATKNMFLDLIVITIFSFFIANVLNQKFALRGFARVVFFLPVILATGLIASVENGDLITGLFRGNTGNEIATGMEGQMGLAQFFNLKELLLNSNIGPGLVQIIVNAIDGISNIVNTSGVQILIFLAGLQSISPSIFEASKVEGATKWEEFCKIKFPMMIPMIFVAAIYTLVDSFTKPSYGILEYIRQSAFLNGRFGYASALAMIFSLIVLIAMGIVALILSRLIKYYD